MDFWLAVVLLTLVGCVTSVVLVVIDSYRERLRLRTGAQTELLRERLAQREQRIAELEDTVHTMKRQLDWHERLAVSPGTDDSSPRDLSR